MPSSTIIDRPPISTDERKLRMEAVNHARASSRLEGVIVPPEIEKMNRQYVDGEFSTSEYVKRVIEAADAMAHKRATRPKM